MSHAIVTREKKKSSIECYVTSMRFKNCLGTCHGFTTRKLKRKIRLRTRQIDCNYYYYRCVFV